MYQLVEKRINRLENRGLTLIEILIAMGITALLTLITLSVLGNVREQAYLTEEVAAGRNLISAYHLYAQDRSGELLPGFDERINSVRYQNRMISFPAIAHRYPFRIAPYLNDKLEGATLLFSNKEFIENKYGTRGFLHDYMLSLNPLFGINHTFVGGHVNASGENMENHNEVLTRLVQIEEPVLVFASSGMGPVPEVAQFNETVGFNVIEAPHTWTSETWSKHSNVDNYGNVSPRHNGKAICAFSDGSVQPLEMETLRDMQLWCRNASRAGNPNYNP